MKQSSASALGDMSYSYGYVARLSGTETATSGDRTIQNETIDMKGIQDGELTLIETRLKTQEGGKRGHLVGKNGIEGVVGGYTKKKFLLIGADNNKEVKFQGLVSIVEGQPNGNKKCLKDVMEGDLKKKSGDVQKLRDKFGDSGLFWPKNQRNGTLSLGGQIVFGNCLKEFYRERGDIEVVGQLKEGASGSQLGFQELNIEGGMSIALTVGMKKTDGKGGRKEEEIIAPGVLVKNVFTNGRTLWTGLQKDGKVIKRGRKNTNELGQGTVVLHDWISTDSKYTDEDLTRGESEKDGFAKKIPLKDEWNWYLWDPSYTKIEKRKLKTKTLLKLSEHLLILLKIILDYKLCIYFSNCFLHTIPLYLEKK
ncbi:hypothetical protein WEN_00120 [Mycoplasma wenyonii str. Massachusetts]|uniref:Uncharacterized protein n=1 Tax=Mycoplasma wenyonii (strain Massachusetts) TaxID=1197325 RepID=I6Z5K9_MYCWM|nr:hypothetical protein [Mycoplasma wenyonii]AFN64833.1 hypothetical protein WEN_00120 [Mycoplasma wenyonii str. Massachusetts]